MTALAVKCLHSSHEQLCDFPLMLLLPLINKETALDW